MKRAMVLNLFNNGMSSVDISKVVEVTPETARRIPKNCNDEGLNRALYDNPSEPVVCLDEKPLQLLGEKRPTIPAFKSGKIEKIDYEYKPMGTAYIFCAVEPKPGSHFAYVSKRKTGCDFAKIVNRLAGIYRNVKTIHIGMDNYSIHNKKSLINRNEEDKSEEIWSQFTAHYTPKHASWLKSLLF